MNPSRIVILPNTSESLPPGKETLYISRKDLGQWVQSGKFFSHMLRYKESKLRVFFSDRIPHPLYIVCLTRLLSRKNCFIEDNDGNQIPVPFTNLFHQVILFTKEYFSRKRFYLAKEREVDGYLDAPVEEKSPTLNLNHSPVYLRTDHSFGLTSGGSVGHTVGVVNNLEYFSATPYMASSVFFPMLSDRIHKFQLKPASQFQNFQELLYLKDNDIFLKQVEPFLKGKDLSFVYHRSSLHNYCGVLLSKNLNLPLVLEFNGSEVWANRNWRTPLKYEELGTRIEDLNFKYAHLIVVVSVHLKTDLVNRGVSPDRILVNPNGVDAEIFHPELDSFLIRSKYNLEGKCVIGFIGTFGKWHGAEILARAFGMLLNTHPALRDTVRLLMVGDGLHMDQVRKELSNAGVTEESILTGLVPQQEGPSHLAACDIFASPHVPNRDGTPFFGSPTKLFEYMAMGRGIVASDLDQIGTLLAHKKTAWMVPPGDAQALADGLKVLIDQPELRNALGKAAREEAVAKHTWREHTGKIIDALKERCQ